MLAGIVEGIRRDILDLYFSDVWGDYRPSEEEIKNLAERHGFEFSDFLPNTVLRRDVEKLKALILEEFPPP